MKHAIDGDGRRYVHFNCPGCREVHFLPIEGTHPVWAFNGDLDCPTLSPSILLRSGHYVPGWSQQKGCWCTPDEDGEPWPFTCHICHSFVRDGRIEFLSDCTHALVGQTVDLVDIVL